jgi:choline kinase
MVGGRMLLRRTLDSLAQAGVTDVGIVIGYRGEEIKAAFSEGHPEVRITWIENPDFDKPNGVSLLAARWFLKGRAFLLMSDHVFCPDVLQPLARLDAKGDATVLVVDSDIARCYDVDDATKVLRTGDLIVDIGKEIPDYDALDTGIFVISPLLVSELAKLEAPSLSDGVRRLARRGLVRAHDINGRLWQDVDTPETKKHTEWLLRAYGQELRGRTPLDNDAAVSFRVPSLEIAATIASGLRKRGHDATVHGNGDMAHWVRVATPGGVVDPGVLQAVLTAATEGMLGLTPLRPGVARASH